MSHCISVWAAHVRCGQLGAPTVEAAKRQGARHVAHAGCWGSEGRRPFDVGKPTAFISESRLRQLLRTCSLPWEQWQLIYEREVHDPVHDFTLGHMITPISSHDPLFWLHHAGLDRGWAVWQQLCGRGGDATRRCGTAASPLGYRPLPPDPKLWAQSEKTRAGPCATRMRGPRCTTTVDPAAARSRACSSPSRSRIACLPARMMPVSRGRRTSASTRAPAIRMRAARGSSPSRAGQRAAGAPRRSRRPRACWTWSESATHAHAGALGRCVVIACGTPPPSTRIRYYVRPAGQARGSARAVWGGSSSGRPGT